MSFRNSNGLKNAILILLNVALGMLSGKDLDITPSQEVPLICTRIGWLVVFTGNSKKYLSGKQISTGDALKICHSTGLQLKGTNLELAGRAETGFKLAWRC